MYAQFVEDADLEAAEQAKREIERQKEEEEIGLLSSAQEIRRKRKQSRQLKPKIPSFEEEYEAHLNESIAAQKEALEEANSRIVVATDLDMLVMSSRVPGSNILNDDLDDK